MLGKLFGAGAKYYLNKKIKGIGEITDLFIDTPQRQLSLSINLKGEDSPIQVLVHNYEVINIKGKNYIKINRFECSKEWINLIALKWAPDLKFPVSPIIAALFK